jgi:hypothetical protein
MATLIASKDPARAPTTESSYDARKEVREQAAGPSSYTWPSLSPIGFIAKESALEVIADRVSLCRSLYVDSPAPALTFAPPEKVYMNYSTTAVTAALAVIRVRRTKFDSDPPLALAVIAYPSIRCSIRTLLLWLGSSREA